RDGGRGECGGPGHGGRGRDTDADVVRRRDRGCRGIGDRDRAYARGRLPDGEYLVRGRRHRRHHDLDRAAIGGGGGAPPPGPGDPQLQVFHSRGGRESQVLKPGTDGLVVPREVVVKVGAEVLPPYPFVTLRRTFL